MCVYHSFYKNVFFRCWYQLEFLSSPKWVRYLLMQVVAWSFYFICISNFFHSQMQYSNCTCKLIQSTANTTAPTAQICNWLLLIWLATTFAIHVKNILNVDDIDGDRGPIVFLTLILQIRVHQNISYKWLLYVSADLFWFFFFWHMATYASFDFLCCICCISLVKSENHWLCHVQASLKSNMLNILETRTEKRENHAKMEPLRGRGHLVANHCYQVSLESCVLWD